MRSDSPFPTPAVDTWRTLARRGEAWRYDAIGVAAARELAAVEAWNAGDLYAAEVWLYLADEALAEDGVAVIIVMEEEACQRHEDRGVAGGSDRPRSACRVGRQREREQRGRLVARR
jgi:hypothetical protein